MIKSMTGFGRAELNDEDKSIMVEIRSVNNKFLKVNTKTPDSLAAFDEKIEQLLRKEIIRGTINFMIEYKTNEQEPVCSLNKKALKEYYNLIRDAQREISFDQDISVERLITLPGVLDYKKKPGKGNLAEGLWLDIEKTIKHAVVDLLQMREVEGRNLQQEIEKWTGNITLLLKKIEKMVPNVVLEYRDRLQERVSSLLEGSNANLGKDDLCKEVAVFADRCDISEELGRLRSHLSMLNDVMEHETPTGRKLEFIVQEMFREVNTVGSKSNNADIIKDVIEIKSEIERIKEQVYNIE